MARAHFLLIYHLYFL